MGSGPWRDAARGRGERDAPTLRRRPLVQLNILRDHSPHGQLPSYGNASRLPLLPSPRLAFLQVRWPSRPWPFSFPAFPPPPGAMASSSIAKLIDLNATFGAVFIGFGASTVSVLSLRCSRSRRLTPRSRPRSAFGIMSMQMYSYFRRYPSDVWWYKCLVRRPLFPAHPSSISTRSGARWA